MCIWTTPSSRWASAFSGARDSALVRACLGGGKPRGSIVGKEIERDLYVHGGNADQRPHVGGIERRGPLEQAARRRKVVGGEALVQPGPALKAEVHRIGIRLSLRAPGLRGKELCAERVGEPRDDFVLHVEEVGDGLVEPFRPEMIAALGVDELDIDAHPAAGALNAALEHIADVQLAPDLLHIDAPALVGEGGVAPDHEGAADARQIGGQALGHAVDEIVLFAGRRPYWRKAGRRWRGAAAPARSAQRRRRRRALSERS